MATPREDHVPIRSALRMWAYVGLNSFGGPAGQIAVMHREIVDRRRWVGERRFMHALNYCMVLPGPEAQQLATYLGWLLNGVRGGIIAGSLFILPGVLVMLVLSIVYATAGSIGWVSGLFAGLQAAVVVLVAQAFVRIARRTAVNARLRTIAAISFLAILLFNLPFPIIVIASGLLGWLWGRRSGADPLELDDEGALLPDTSHLSPVATRGALRTAAVFAVLWAVPVVILALAVGTASVFTQEAFLFSKAAVLTFGGAYAVLGYIAQEAVGRFGWVTPSDMAAGLGLAETTPGPLVLVLQFVGFLAAYNNPGSLPPIAAGMLGALITVWVTFIPCFLFIFLGAPFAERLRGNPGIASALAAIAAAVTGVILDLALWLALHTVFATVSEATWGPLRIAAPDFASVQWTAVGIGALAAVLIFRFKAPTLAALGGCAGLGALAALIG